jgi:hypothetical protein
MWEKLMMTLIGYSVTCIKTFEHSCKILGFHDGDYEEWRLLGCYAVGSCKRGRSRILVTLMMEALSFSETSVLRNVGSSPKRRFVQEPGGVNIPEDAILRFIFQFSERTNRFFDGLLKIYLLIQETENLSRWNFM